MIQTGTGIKVTCHDESRQRAASPSQKSTLSRTSNMRSMAIPHHGRRPCGLLFERKVHALMTPVLLWLARANTFNANA